MLSKIISRETISKILTAFISIIIALGLCEIVLRVINYYPKIIQAKMFVANNSDILPYKLKPDYDGDYIGREVKIDHDGLRIVKPDFQIKNSDTKQKSKVILILGDSLVFGHGLNDNETIASQLQSAVWRKGMNYTIKNIGVPGYTSWNEYAAFDLYLKKYPVDELILLYVPNDVTLDNDHFGLSKGKFTDTSDSSFHKFTQFMYSHLYVTFLIADSFKMIAHRLSNNENAAKFDEKDYLSGQALDYSMDALTKIQDICRQNKITFAVGIYRDVWHYSNPQFSLKYEGVIKDNLDKRGIKSFLVKSHIENLSLADDRVFWGDPHPSVKAVGYIVGDIMNNIEQERQEEISK